MQKKWDIKKAGNSEIVDRLSSELKISPIISNLLVQRNITNYDEAKRFFRPSLKHLHNPFLMKDMDKAIDRLDQAFVKKEKILIYGDYDVDGTTAISIIYLFLTKYYMNIDFYIPDRYEEGYGISIKGVDFAKENDFTLVIALDCGIKAVEQVKYANELGIDFIICDHHQPAEEIPPAIAVLDPKRIDCEYPYKELSGCGVGFKFLQAFCERNNLDYEELYELIDLVAVSIASDIVPLTGENRVLAHFGLKKLNEQPVKGLEAIIKVSGIQGKEILINDIVFKIGPRINAAGRMESAKKAVELLISRDESIAWKMSEGIDKDNDERKNFDRQITIEALDEVASNEDLINKKTTVLYNPDWHKGVIGIVASRLTETYYRPTVILTESNGFATGSARSVEGYDLYAAVEACSDLLENFGGHMYAAGLTMKVEHVPIFKERFEKYVSETIDPEMLVPKITIDAGISLEEINIRLLRILKQFQPFGPENMTPIFASENVKDIGHGRVVGRNQEHLMMVVCEENSTATFHSIAYKMAPFYPIISNNKLFDICYSIEENNYKGNTSLQLRIRDIKEKDA
jgi:single-stranded-DNA-specific exonuclease